MSPEIKTLDDLVLDVTSETFPELLSNRLGGRCIINSAQAREFFSIAFTKNRTVKPEIVVGYALSMLLRIGKNAPEDSETLPWLWVRNQLITHFHYIRRYDKYWNAYWILFYDATLTAVNTLVVDTLLEKFCKYLRFRGAISYDDDEFITFFDKIDVNADQLFLDVFQNDDRNAQLIPQNYVNDMVSATTTQVKSIVESINNTTHSNGGPYELLSIILRLIDAVPRIRNGADWEEATTFYTPEASDNPINANFVTGVRGLVNDIARGKKTAFSTENKDA